MAADTKPQLEHTRLRDMHIETKNISTKHVWMRLPRCTRRPDRAWIKTNMPLQGTEEPGLTRALLPKNTSTSKTPPMTSTTSPPPFRSASAPTMPSTDGCRLAAFRMRWRMPRSRVPKGKRCRASRGAVTDEDAHYPTPQWQRAQPLLRRTPDAAVPLQRRLPATSQGGDVKRMCPMRGGPLLHKWARQMRMCPWSGWDAYAARCLARMPAHYSWRACDALRSDLGGLPNPAEVRYGSRRHAMRNGGLGLMRETGGLGGRNRNAPPWHEARCLGEILRG